MTRNRVNLHFSHYRRRKLSTHNCVPYSELVTTKNRAFAVKSAGQVLHRACIITRAARRHIRHALFAPVPSQAPRPVWRIRNGAILPF